jgi:hypothetical protein
MYGHTIAQASPPLAIAEYAAGLARHGVRIVPGASESFWIRHEVGAMLRVPTFHRAPPTAHELGQVFWRGPAAVVSYLVDPDERHPANAWLYLCRDRAYALDKRSRSMPRNVRQGLKAFRITPLTLEQVLASGFQAFNDTLHRVGLSGGGPEEFHRSFAWRAKVPGHVFLGAWKDAHLVAFLSIIEVADWAEIEGSYSQDVWLPLKPNDALLFTALSQYLMGGRARLVSYGLSSIQAPSNEVGLHEFKTRVGFEALPVHRAFRLHPLLHPLANRLTRWGVNSVLRVSPGNRRLKKVDGVLAALSGEHRLPRAV